MVSMMAEGGEIMNAILCSIPAREDAGNIKRSDSLETFACDNIVEKAIGIVPDSQKTAYLEALKRCPNLVESDSNAMRFLKRENCNPSDAAKRLISYWEDRKKAFGERAFLPLNSTSYTEEAFCALWQGVYQILPNDGKGRKVVYCDDKILSRLSLKSRLQLVFFLDYIAQWQQSNRKIDDDSNNKVNDDGPGIVLITAVDNISFDCTSKAVTLLIRNSMPTLVSSIHILCKNFSENDKTALRLVGWLLDEKTVVHACKTTNERAQKLLPFNLDQGRLPKFLGGFAKVNPWEGLDSQTSPVYCRGVETNTLQKGTNGLYLLNKAIANIPDHEKKTYVKAMTLAPHIVETESNPTWFLEYDRFDFDAAAQRLVAYWEERNKAFGDKTFLPLATLTNVNAYDDETKRALREGVMVVLPNDSCGRTVSFCDSNKIYEKPYDARVQLMFYIYTMAMQNHRSREEGFILVILTSELGSFPRRSDVIRIGRRVMPMRVYSVHLLSTGKERLERNVDGPVSLPVLRFITGERTYIHLAKAPGEYASKLVPYGFAKNRLPKIIGGSWNTDPWCTTKIQLIVENSLNYRTNCSDDYNREDPSNQIADTNESILALIPKSISRPGLTLTSTGIQTVHRERDSWKVIPGETVNIPQLFCHERGKDRLLQIVRESRKLIPEKCGNCLSPARAPLGTHRGSIMELLAASVSEFTTRVNSTLPSNGAQTFACENRKKRRRKSTIYGLKAGKRQPSQFDVLLGQGRSYLGHPGNQQFHSLVEASSDRYDATNKTKEKACIRREIFDTIRCRGSFLTLENDQCFSWYEVTDDVADKKIGQALRNNRQKLTPAKNLPPDVL